MINFDSAVERGLYAGLVYVVNADYVLKISNNYEIYKHMDDDEMYLVVFDTNREHDQKYEPEFIYCETVENKEGEKVVPGKTYEGITHYILENYDVVEEVVVESGRKFRGY